MNNANHSRILAAWLFAAWLLLDAAVSALAEVHYVDVNSTNATPPYTNWTTAATNIQDAVDAAVAGDEIVVTNGIYGPVYVDKPLSVRSVNGPVSTTINGGRSRRCVSLSYEASLSGFTLVNGYIHNPASGAPAYGGGAYGVGAGSCTLNNCALTRNSVEGVLNSQTYGGGAYACTLNNCTLSGNSATDLYSASTVSGGGAYACTLNNCTLGGNYVSFHAECTGGGAAYCTLNNCTLTGNIAYGALGSGGGSSHCTLNNCIAYFNTAGSYPDYDRYSTVNYCCTMYDPGGIGNITNAPLFVDGDLRLQPNSPCINAGNNSYVTNATDLDGNPRIAGGTVDIGAYEYQWPQLTIVASGPNVLLRWPTNNAGYDYTGFTLQSTTNLGSPAVWATISPAQVVIGGQNVVTNPFSCPQQFYRLKQ